MDGKHFPMSEYKAGVTAPPFHPFCRSIVVPYSVDGFGDRKVLGKENSEEQIEKIVANG